MVTMTQHKKYSNKVRFHWFAKETIKKSVLIFTLLGGEICFLMPRLSIGPKLFEMRKNIFSKFVSIK